MDFFIHMNGCCTISSRINTQVETEPCRERKRGKAPFWGFAGYFSRFSPSK